MAMDERLSEWGEHLMDPTTALIAGVSAIVGGIIGGLLRPWGEDYINRKAEDRANLKSKAEQHVAAERLRVERRLQTLDDTWRAIADAPRSPGTREVLPRFSASVGDSALDEHMGRMVTGETPEARASAQADALRRVGELQREATEA
jgi:hypothetical protein